jgi:UDP-N-acetylglucosamine--N-acetylmuramyl-(pentapeptide) pyrophosphoryl-undecaprenol N-acetylglucosamine transferase
VAEKIFVAYEETRDQFPPSLRDKVVVTGNPVRKEILEGDRDRGREALGVQDGELLLLVLGGSQGALQVNDLIRALAPELVKSSRILHQMGDLTYKESNLTGYDTRRFIGAELPDYLAAADLVVSRAGAGTLWELASLAKPMILIPLGSGSSRGDQLKNAEMLEKKGAARVLTGEVSEDHLLQVLQELLNDPQKRESLSRGCAGVVRGRADRDIAGFILDRVIKEEVV